MSFDVTRSSCWMLACCHIGLCDTSWRSHNNETKCHAVLRTCSCAYQYMAIQKPVAVPESYYLRMSTCSPEAHEGIVLSLLPLGAGGDFRRWYLVEGPRSLEGDSWKGCWDTYLCHLPCYEVSIWPAMCSHFTTLLCHKLKSNKLTDHELILQT